MELILLHAMLISSWKPSTNVSYPASDTKKIQVGLPKLLPKLVETCGLTYLSPAVEELPRPFSKLVGLLLLVVDPI
ncbi:hypothetical protein SADUNF_Sadunf08G0115000 [Salix dunnii]|uniref:Uncharacterized protein n=1 Tax=Salix dunnii TaxID=1413687 RepID=A0A835JYE1_9ROSI|nr:hypothetical protein SADUNF_Sadunf08G0115000 [Salix dunnii]